MESQFQISISPEHSSFRVAAGNIPDKTRLFKLWVERVFPTVRTAARPAQLLRMLACKQVGSKKHLVCWLIAGRILLCSLSNLGCSAYVRLGWTRCRWPAQKPACSGILANRHLEPATASWVKEVRQKVCSRVKQRRPLQRPVSGTVLWRKTV